MGFFHYYPPEGSRGDIRAALISSTIANVNRGKNQKPFKINDFMLDFEPRKAPSRTNLMDKMKNILNSIGAKKVEK